MKIKAFILFLMVIISGCSKFGFGEDWVKCGYTSYYDANSIKTLPNGNKMMASKNTLSPAIIAVNEYNCSNDTFRLRSATYEGEDVPQNNKFEPIPNKKTVIDIMFFVACNQRYRWNK